MSKKYQHLLSPIKIGNTVFKNRLIASASKPYFIQGTEPYPTDKVINHYTNKAKNGAAIVTVNGSSPPLFDIPYADRIKERAAHPSWFNPERPWFAWGSHTVTYAELDAGCEHYFSEMTEAIHFYKSVACMQINAGAPGNYDVSNTPPSSSVTGFGFETLPDGPGGIEVPAAMLDGVAEEFARQAAYLKEVGFDMVQLHMAYRATLAGRFLSTILNKRNDEFGGSHANRMRFPLMIADRIKQRCGKDFLIDVCISGAEPAGGYTLEDAIEYAKLFAGHIDMLQIRAGDIDHTHPVNYNLTRMPFLHMAEAIKKSGVPLAIVTIGGYQNLDDCEDVIASGKADFIAGARAWITNPDFGRKAYEGRGEDVVPCLWCNQCHISSYHNPWTTVCAVNPTWGLEDRINRMIEPPSQKMKVAVIGGGPAGMEAALIAAGRGHNVTLYEKTGALGGLLKTTETVSFKWPVKDFKNYLVRQIGKTNVKVCLNTEATPEMLKAEEYDAVLAAIGAEWTVPPIPGIKGKNVVLAENVFGNEDALEKNVVVIGGGEVGIETGMHLVEKGHKVTVLEMGNMLAPKAPPVHFYAMFKEAWEKLPDFHAVVNARCTGIEANKVTYVDADGKKHTIAAGSVVLAAGMKSKQDLALKFNGTADRLYLIGDCNEAGNIQKSMRSAFSTASML
jgi:2,4-dienoyl-CoA reductase-like NADH-dependent reductase (Old Yellow Enzyme family)/thioredoxin reductase